MQGGKLCKDGKNILCKAENFVKLGGTFYTRRKTLCPLLSLDCRQVQAQARLPHRCRRIHQVQRIQKVNELTKESQEPGAIHFKPKAKIKLRTTNKQRETACEISRIGWRSSQNISKTQKCQHPQTCLMTQTRNVAPRKHSIYTYFPKDQNCEVCKRTEIKRAPCTRRTGESVLRAEKFGDLIIADHKVLNEGYTQSWYKI